MRLFRLVRDQLIRVIRVIRAIRVRLIRVIRVISVIRVRENRVRKNTSLKPLPVRNFVP